VENRFITALRVDGRIPGFDGFLIAPIFFIPGVLSRTVSIENVSYDILYSREKSPSDCDALDSVGQMRIALDLNRKNLKTGADSVSR
jgi:hypothetical protein